MTKMRRMGFVCLVMTAAFWVTAYPESDAEPDRGMIIPGTWSPRILRG